MQKPCRFSAHAISSLTQWNTSCLTCPVSAPHITVSAYNFPRGLRGVWGRLTVLAARAGAFVHLPVLSRVASHEPRGPTPEDIISSSGRHPFGANRFRPSLCFLALQTSGRIDHGPDPPRQFRHRHIRSSGSCLPNPSRFCKLCGASTDVPRWRALICDPSDRGFGNHMGVVGVGRPVRLRHPLDARRFSPFLPFLALQMSEDLRPSEAVQASPHSVFRLMFAKTAETLARSGTPRLVSRRVGELPTALVTKIQLETPESRCYRYGYASPEKYLCSGPLAASWQVPKPSAYSARCHPKICRATDAVSALEPFSST